MSDWTILTLDEVVKLRRGFDLPYRDRRPGPYPVLSAGLTTGWHDEGPIKGPGFAIGRATNLGVPTWTDSDYWPLNTTLYASDFCGNDPKYVFHLFETLDLSGYDSGSVQPMLNRNYVAKISVNIAPLGTQRAIAEVLEALDDKISANSRMASTAKQIATLSLADIPPSTPLAAISIHHRKMVNPEEIDLREVLHYSLPAFDAAQIPKSESPETIKSSKFLIQTPCVLLSKLNPRFPRVWDVREVTGKPMLSSTEFLVLESRFSTSSVLWAILSQASFGLALEAKVAGTSSSHQRVRPADLLATNVVDPRSLNKGLHDQLTSLGARIDLCRQESAKLAAIRNVLLPNLMSGKIRVKDAEKAIGGVI